ncbi:hypothetical protein GCM10027277_26880 [Pseudoduganella ginsengisoli]
MHRMKLFLPVLCALTLSACGGGSDSPSVPVVKTLQAGQSLTMSAGQSVNVPAGTTVNSGTNTVNIMGHNSTVNTSAGAIVTVSAGAAGPADNVVIAK